jgi:hypothetical protein
MDVDDNLKRRIDEIERRGKAKYGDDGWTDRLEALGRVGVGGEALAQTLARPDALEEIDFAAREALLRLMNSDDRGIARAAGEAYGRARQEDRDAHALARGRKRA